MKKFILIGVMGLTMMSTIGCGQTAKAEVETVTEPATIVEEVVTEVETKVEKETTSAYVSDEYLKDLEYNSRTNSYRSR